MAAACFGGEVRVCGVDAGQAPQAFAIRSIEEREENTVSRNASAEREFRLRNFLMEAGGLLAAGQLTLYCARSGRTATCIGIPALSLSFSAAVFGVSRPLSMPAVHTPAR